MSARRTSYWRRTVHGAAFLAQVLTRRWTSGGVIAARGLGSMAERMCRRRMTSSRASEEGRSACIGGPPGSAAARHTSALWPSAAHRYSLGRRPGHRDLRVAHCSSKGSGNGRGSSSTRGAPVGLVSLLRCGVRFTFCRGSVTASVASHRGGGRMPPTPVRRCAGYGQSARWLQPLTQAIGPDTVGAELDPFRVVVIGVDPERRAEATQLAEEGGPVPACPFQTGEPPPPATTPARTRGAPAGKLVTDLGCWRPCRVRMVAGSAGHDR